MAEPVIPGQDLGPTALAKAGPGTHVHQGRIRASVLGQLRQTASGPAKRATKITAADLPTLSVGAAGAGAGAAGAGATRAELIPAVGSEVLCRVTRLTPRQAAVAILVVGRTVVEGEWQGLIRAQDVRATEKERVRIVDSFRPGDVVRAVVVSLP
jgi:exosome complex component CSL4